MWHKAIWKGHPMRLELIRVGLLVELANHYRRATQFLEKYTSHFIWKGCVWEGVGDRTEVQHIDPHSYGHQHFFPVLLAAQPGAWGPRLSRCWFSLPHLNSNSSDLQLTDFLSLPGLYNNLTSTLLPASVTIALIQPVHGQGYNILIFLDRMHLLFTQVHFLFWQPGSQYTTSGL